MYKIESQPTTEFGIIPHYKDLQYIKKVKGSESYKIINILDGFKVVLNEVLDCKGIISSSLHGLVLADAYGLKAAWLQVDRGKRLAGKGFKFEDYLLSTHRDPIVNQHRGRRALNLKKIKWLGKPRIILQLLLNSCPFSKYKTLSDIPTKILN
jgi:pyruvyltransferase